MPEWCEHNANDLVRVKLKASGVACYREWHRQLEPPLVYHPPKEDGDGWTEWMLWEFMNIFGPMMVMGVDSPFEGNAIQIKKG